ncbi:MAG: tetratricopeptide repeat protein [Phycisphaerae bacterium]|jgi:TolA-binding protein
MNLRTVSIKTVFVLAALFQYCALSAFGGIDPNEYKSAYQLEVKGDFAKAKAIYERMIEQFPNDRLAGPDNAGFRIKLIALSQALSDNDIASARAIVEQTKSLASLPRHKPNQLFRMAQQFETKKLFADAVALYRQVIADYPDSPMAGPDNASFRVKYVACLLAKEKGDIAAVKTIAAEIKTLNASPQQKPGQLYSVGTLLESAGALQDALSAYRQVITEYPNSPAAGPDKAGFHIKYVAGFLAKKNGDTAAARTIAAEIKTLNASPQQKPGQLYSAGFLLESAGFLQDALSVYQDVISKYPDSPAAGPDKAGFHIKYVAGLLAKENGDIAAVKTIAAEIKTLNASPQQKPSQLYSAGKLFEIAGSWQDARLVYRQVITKYPDSPAAKKADIRNDCVVPLENICDGNLAVAISGTAAIKAKYAGSPAELTDMLFNIGETYYLEGQKNNQSEFFRQSAGLFENDVFSLTLNDTLKAAASYMLGLNYQQLGEYLKAADAFGKSYQADPKFEYADYCLFAVGRCYEKLLEQGSVSQTDAKAVIAAQYLQLISEYPQSKGAPYVREWLKNNPK